ncbi:MAG: ankyrin repeat domain-containing protein [Campylobacterota bacterium]|nr:ankyrin repeat domain-containing protein [Campylobacterota bacterium]
MAFMERLQSKLILNTSLYHPQEAHVIEHPEHDFYEAIKLAQHKHLETLILDGFNVDHNECAHTPPLIYAIMLKEYRAIETLLSYGASANIQNSHRQSALHIAIHYRLHEIIHLLLRHGASTDNQDSDGISPLALAQLLEDEQSITLLKNTPAMYRANKSIYESAKEGDLFSIVLAKTLGENLHVKSTKGNTLLHFAVLSLNIKLVCYLLNSGCKVDEENDYLDTPLTLLSRHRDNTAMLKFLLQRDATLEHKNSVEESALSLSIKFGHAKSAEFLINSGADVNSFMNINTPLTLTHEAIFYYTTSADEFRNLETLLLIKGAHVDVITNELQWTPLIQCATNAHTQNMLEHLEMLITLGANVDHADKNGRTALMLCSTMQRMDAINILLKHYCDVNLVDNFEWTALMFSCYYNNYSLAKLLLEYGSNINFNSSNGNSALKIAKEKKYQSIIQLLSDNGAVIDKD